MSYHRSDCSNHGLYVCSPTLPTAKTRLSFYLSRMLVCRCLVTMQVAKQSSQQWRRCATTLVKDGPSGVGPTAVLVDG